MSNPTSNPLSFPVSPDDKRPLPEIAAARCGFPLAFHDLDDERYYAVQDWIRGVAKTTDASNFWNSLKRRFRKIGIETSTLCIGLPYRATDGKTYKRDFAQAEFLYQVTQRMEADTGLRNDVLEFLAKSGVAIDEMRLDPEQAIDAAIEAYRRQGKSDAWIHTRLQSKCQR